VAEEIIDRIKTLHATLVDAKTGYLAAVKEADKSSSSIKIFEEMATLHGEHAGWLQTLLLSLGEPVEKQGSFVYKFLQAIMNARIFFGGDRGDLLGLIDGEIRTLNRYEEALRAPPTNNMVTTVLLVQRNRVSAALEKMKMRAWCESALRS
jgi:hypothetical protein